MTFFDNTDITINNHNYHVLKFTFIVTVRSQDAADNKIATVFMYTLSSQPGNEHYFDYPWFYCNHVLWLSNTQAEYLLLIVFLCLPLNRLLSPCPPKFE